MTAIISKYGEFLCTIQGNQETVELNKPAGCLVVSDPPKSNMFYENGWIEMPPQSSSFHIFDYEFKQWIEPRTLEQIQDHKWFEIKTIRDQLEFGGFEFEGNIYDSDQVSQGRIMGAAAAQVAQVWTLANNEMVELTAIQLSQLYQTLQAHIANIHERGRIARQLIYEATSVNQVELITL